MRHFTDKIHLERFQGVESDAGHWYKHIEILGSGGNAITALVIATSPPNRGNLFAIKIFKRLADAKRRERFLNESAFLKTCSHPSIMRVVDTGRYKYTSGGIHYDYPFVVAEYLPSTLYDRMRENTALLPEKVSYIVQILSALCYLQDLNPSVIHRDIKPQNIFVKGGSCVLGDFGLMKVVGSEIRGDPKAFYQSLGGVIPWMYRTPDLVSYAKGESQLTPASDVFQLGLIAAELFSGRNPCRRVKNALDKIEVDSVAHIPGNMGNGISTLIQRMLAINPRDRPSAPSLLDSWENILWSSIYKVHDIEGCAFRK
jgi:serine/threonine protein kinase